MDSQSHRCLIKGPAVTASLSGIQLRVLEEMEYARILTQLLALFPHHPHLIWVSQLPPQIEAAPEADDSCMKVTCCPKYRDTKNLPSPSTLIPDASQATLPPVTAAILLILTHDTSPLGSPEEQALGTQ